MALESDRDKVLFQISHVLRTRCRGYLKIKKRVKICPLNTLWRLPQDS
jgi:hypothetical protein